MEQGSDEARAAGRDLTALLVTWSQGRRGASDELFDRLHKELRKLAGAVLRDDRPSTLQPTALVHEAYLRLIDQRRVRWQNRAHFFAIAAKLMRRIVMDHARRRSAYKRGGEFRKVSLDGEEPWIQATGQDALALDQALERLERKDPLKASLVELRFFGGLTMKEVAEVQGCSKATVERHWEMARAWLYRELS